MKITNIAILTICLSMLSSCHKAHIEVKYENNNQVLKINNNVYKNNIDYVFDYKNIQLFRDQFINEYNLLVANELLLTNKSYEDFFPNRDSIFQKILKIEDNFFESNRLMKELIVNVYFPQLKFSSKSTSPKLENLLVFKNDEILDSNEFNAYFKKGYFQNCVNSFKLQLSPKLLVDYGHLRFINEFFLQKNEGTTFYCVQVISNYNCFPAAIVYQFEIDHRNKRVVKNILNPGVLITDVID